MTTTTTTSPFQKGDLVMIRTYSAGVHFGTLESHNNQEVMLTNAHRVHYWENACSLSQLSQAGSGSKSGNNRISVSVPKILLTQTIEIIDMTEEAFKNLTEKLWKS